LKNQQQKRSSCNFQGKAKEKKRKERPVDNKFEPPK
jgi:hypothetical protein